MKKELKQLYQASAKNVVQVEVPTLNYIMVDGEGDPNTSPAYAQAVEALFSVANMFGKPRDHDLLVAFAPFD